MLLANTKKLYTDKSLEIFPNYVDALSNKGASLLSLVKTIKQVINILNEGKQEGQYVDSCHITKDPIFSRQTTN